MASLLFRCGTVALTAGEEQRSVTGLGLPFEPSLVTVAVRKPNADADLISAFVVDGFTEDGFSVQFSAPLAEDGYKLDWTAYADGAVAAGDNTLALGYKDFFAAVRRFLGYAATLTEDQIDEIDGYVQSGVRQFYYPPAEGRLDAHEWSFLHQVSQVTTTADEEAVTVPNLVGRIMGDLLYTNEAWNTAPVPVVGEGVIMTHLARNPDERGRPRLACLRHTNRMGAAGQVNEIVFFPVPGGEITYTFRMECAPQPLSEDNPFPLGGPKFSEIVLESCLAIAEQRANDEAGLHTQRFMQLLESAIAQDMRSGAEYFGPVSGPEGGHAPGHPLRDGRMTITFHGQVL